MTLFPEEETKIRVEQMLETVCEHIHNGDCGVDSFKADEFDYSKTLGSLLQSYSHPYNDYGYSFDLKWSYILGTTYVQSSGLAEELKYFFDNQLVLAMFGFYPNPEQCTESEYCSIYNVYIYLKTGQRLHFYFDYTT